MKTTKQKTEEATFGAGCFWGVEEAFRNIEGVYETVVGFMGGTTKHPTYEEVCTGKTGHAEVVHVTYDPSRVSYDELLDVFWRIHNPTQKNRQGPDEGSQYRSVIFYHTDDQKYRAEQSKRALEESHIYENPIVTEIQPAGIFYKAEDYHQKYIQKHGGGAVC